MGEIKAVKMLKANPAYYFVQLVSANVFTKGSGKNINCHA